MNIKTVINDKTDTDSRLHASVMIIRLMEQERLKLKKELEYYKNFYVTCDDYLSKNHDCYVCQFCGICYDEDDINSTICGLNICADCNKIDKICCENCNVACCVCKEINCKKCEEMNISKGYQSNICYGCWKNNKTK